MADKEVTRSDLRPSERSFNGAHAAGREDPPVGQGGQVTCRSNTNDNFHFRRKGQVRVVGLVRCFFHAPLVVDSKGGHGPPGGMTTIAAIEIHERRNLSFLQVKQGPWNEIELRSIRKAARVASVLRGLNQEFFSRFQMLSVPMEGE